MQWKFWQRTDPVYMEDDSSSFGWIAKTIGAFIVVYLLLASAVAWWWDEEPDQFVVREHAALIAQRNNENLVTGYITTTTLIEIAKTLTDKRGGYLSNDVFPPGIWMDNIPEWEFGVLSAVRDTVRIYRNDFSRSQSQSIEDPDLSIAEGHFFFDSSSWILPQTEDEYREGIRLFESYRSRLADPEQTNAQFYARADNLQAWLAAMETRIGSLSQRLSTSVGKRQLNLDLAGDTTATQATAAPQDSIVKTPWLEVDNVFYQARGFSWALLHLLRALEHDFGDVLDKKAARVSLQQIIRELERTQDTLWSPMVLNGDGLGPLANHSLIMASYISRANAALIDLRSLLSDG